MPASRCAALAATFALLPAALAAVDPGRAAAEAYERGDCETVLRTLGALSEKETARLDGLAHYRWGFCLAHLRRGDPRRHYEKAAELLAERAPKEDASLEEHFYRVNALLNLRRSDEARAAAAAAVERYEKGTLLVPEGDPDAWFRLGKLYRDAGNDKGALGPFGRALDAAEKRGEPLRVPYLERILQAARAVGAGSLVLRATQELKKVEPAAGADPITLARARLARGDLPGAREAIAPLVNRPGEAATDARYVLAVIDRALELAPQHRTPMQKLPDGREVAALTDDELQQQIGEVVAEVGTLLRDGEVRQVPRKKGEGTRPLPTKEVRGALWDAQARLAGLLLEAVQRGVDLRGWAMRGGFARLAFKPLVKLFVEQARERPASDEAPAAESPGDGEEPGASDGAG